MNKLPRDKRRLILHLMVEGNSVRGIARLADVSPVTVLRYLELAGAACAEHHDKTVRGVKAQRIEADEIWSFNYCKDAALKTAKAAPQNAGSIWTWTAIDRDSKLIVSYLVGGRDASWAKEFMHDVASRVANKIQLTTDGHTAYLKAVNEAFGPFTVDYAQLIKHYGPSPDVGPERKYSPGVCVGTYGLRVRGNPDPESVSTSFVETHNQKMRLHMRRFTRLTPAHSKKFENHCHMVALYTTFYNFARINSAVRMTPAMEARLSDHVWDIGEIVTLIDTFENSEREVA